MTRRESALKEAGIDLHFNSENNSVAASSNGLAFSGYGEFTPITVRSDTVMLNADLERRKS